MFYILFNLAKPSNCSCLNRLTIFACTGEIENSNWTMDDTVLMYKILDEIRRQLGLKYPDEDE